MESLLNMKLGDFLKRVWNRGSNEEVDTKTNKSFFAKDASGQWWFFGIYSNKFKDRDGEIFSEESHKEYISWLKETGFKPMLTAYHLPRMPKGFWVKVFDLYENDIPTLQRVVDKVYSGYGYARAEYVNYVNGFMTVSGKIFPGKEDIVEKLAELSDMGMSHGFIVKESSANIFDKYRTFEMSTLKNKRAANRLTSTKLTREGESIMKSEKGFDPKDREILTRVFGETAIAGFEMDTEGAEKILSETVEYKGDFMDTEEKQEVETEAAAPEGQETEAKVETEAEIPAPQDKSVLTVDVLAEGVVKSFTDLQSVLTEMQKELVALRADHKKMSDELAATRATVKEVKKSEDEKIASAWLPVLNFRAGYSASEASDNLVENKQEKDALTEKAPEGEKITTEAEKMENPLYALAWSHILPKGQ